MYISKTIQSRMIHTTHRRYVVYTRTFLSASPSIKLITGTDPYVGYCIPHTNQYHANKKIRSVVAFSLKAVVIKTIRRKRSNQIPCTFLCTCY